MSVSSAEIHTLLPQTQCRECGFDGCLPYAEALAEGKTEIDRCPPGGTKTLEALAKLLKQDATPYIEAISKNTRPPVLAYIREAECIGCTKCIQACPVDAIIGSAKKMHTVLSQECTGCRLCIAPCPVDCIDLIAIETYQFDKIKAHERWLARRIRMVQKSSGAKKNIAQKPTDQEQRLAYVKAAVARAKAKRGS